MKISKIPLARLSIIAFTIALVPSIWILVSLQANFDQCVILETRISEDINLAESLSPLLTKQFEVKKNLKGADSNFVNKHLETFIPLASEIDVLKERSHRGFLPDEEPLKRRLDFLTSGQNGITFVEGAIQTNRGIKSTIESQTKPVEMGSSDVVEFLYRIEGNVTTPELGKIKPPHLQLLECRLERKKQSQGNPQHQSTGEVYLFSSKLLKQECVE